MQFLQICVHPQDIGGAEGPKTSMFVIFGPSVKRFKTGVLTMVAIFYHYYYITIILFAFSLSVGAIDK